VDIVDGTGKGILAIKLLSKSVWNISYRMAAQHYVMLCVCLFVCWVNRDKFVHRNKSYDMCQALAG
jgi:hypothetical protein